MRCYRCGTVMNNDAGVCPECGFILNSPAEIHMFEEMNEIRIYDEEQNILWSGDGNGTAYIDAPENRKIRICWGTLTDHEIVISVRNGEAYRFGQRYSKMAKRLEDAQLVKIRTIPKRGRNDHGTQE